MCDQVCLCTLLQSQLAGLGHELTPEPLLLLGAAEQVCKAKERITEHHFLRLHC